jgi:hypothetical protein
MHGFNNEATGALLLDTERAFNEVWTTELIAKLIMVKIPPHLIHTIHSIKWLIALPSVTDL